MNQPTIKVILNHRNEKNQSELYSVYLRITINRVSKYVRIPTQKISKKHWNVKNNGENFVKNDHFFAFEINNQIRDYRNKVNEVIKRFYALDKTITHKDILDGIKRKGEAMLFNDFAKQYIANPKEKFELATITKHKTCLSGVRNTSLISCESSILLLRIRS